MFTGRRHAAHIDMHGQPYAKAVHAAAAKPGPLFDQLTPSNLSLPA